MGLRRAEDEEYNARATFEYDSIQTVVNLDELTLRFRDQRWNLAGPARVTWGEALLDVEGFRLRAPNGTGLDLSVEVLCPAHGVPAIEGGTVEMRRALELDGRSG